MRWVKLYVEILDDHKMALLPDDIFRSCINLIALAGRVDDAGRLGCTEEVAYALRLSHEQSRAHLEELRKVRVTTEKKGVWYLKNFDKRNERAPSSQREAVKQRVKKHREIKAIHGEVKQISNDPVTTLHAIGNDPRIDKNRVEEKRGEKPEGAGKKTPARHPALLAYQEAAKFNPDRSQNDTIIAAVGDIPENIERWKQTVAAYCLLGWNKRNVAGMLEFFQRGEMPHASRNGKSEPSASSQLRALGYTDAKGNPV